MGQCPLRANSFLSFEDAEERMLEGAAFQISPALKATCPTGAEVVPVNLDASNQLLLENRLMEVDHPAGQPVPTTHLWLTPSRSAALLASVSMQKPPIIYLTRLNLLSLDISTYA